MLTQDSNDTTTAPSSQLMDVTITVPQKNLQELQGRLNTLSKRYPNLYQNVRPKSKETPCSLMIAVAPGQDSTAPFDGISKLIKRFRNLGITITIENEGALIAPELPCKKSNYRLFFRADSRSQFNEPPSVKSTPSEHMNLDGKNSYHNSGYISLFEFTGNDASIESWHTIQGDVTHLVFIPTDQLQTIQLNNTSAQQLPIHFAEKKNQPLILETSGVDKLFVINQDGEKINTEKCGNRMIMCHEHLLVGPWHDEAIALATKEEYKEKHKEESTVLLYGEQCPIQRFIEGNLTGVITITITNFENQKTLMAQLQKCRNPADAIKKLQISAYLPLDNIPEPPVNAITTAITSITSLTSPNNHENLGTSVVNTNGKRPISPNEN